jgi:ribosomal-protein-alanine N-acetyltransferase
MTKKKLFRISGRKVFLRSPEISDLAEFTALAKKSERFHRGLMRFAKTKTEFEGFLERAVDPSSEVLLICEAGSGAIAGMINLSQIFYGPLKSAYMGYGLGVDFTGKGYATEAVELMTRHAFTNLGLHRLEANIQPGNIASINVVKRAGFRKEGYSPRYLKIGGTWRDHERWAITREDWEGK